MHEKGCRFALDDFGTGLSSFAYLKYLSVDYLKIDGVFVKGIVDDPIDYAMVKSIHEIGKVMGKKTVAEFVGNADIELKIKAFGVDFSQGYSIAVPCPVHLIR
jgi:EAL domain-containing protein (putative c-di-GMP-specific phosphodiesterase class I)